MKGLFHLFTYGSLKAGAASAEARALLARCERVGPGSVRGTLYDVGDYPALLLAGDDRISGEIWRCPAHALPDLDRYEGVAEGLFRRVGVEVDGRGCWTYVAGPGLGPGLVPDRRIQSGRWEGREERSGTSG